MILVHRRHGEPFHVNADLVETVESAPDTTLVLVDGRRIVVEEDPGTVVARVVSFRASLLVAADDLRDDDRRAGAPPLSLVPQGD